MKSVTTFDQSRAKVRLTDRKYFQTSVTLISFLNDKYSNFLNAFFLRSVATVHLQTNM